MHYRIHWISECQNIEDRERFVLASILDLQLKMKWWRIKMMKAILIWHTQMVQNENLNSQADSQISTSDTPD